MITPTRLGTFPVICIELCGLGHSTMRSQAVVMTQADFNNWYKAAGKAAPASRAARRPASPAQAIFNNNGCGACHTFARPQVGQGKIGPDLDNLKRRPRRTGAPLDEFIRESIVDPNAYIAPGYAKGDMPETFKTRSLA